MSTARRQRWRAAVVSATCALTVAMLVWTVLLYPVGRTHGAVRLVLSIVLVVAMAMVPAVGGLVVLRRPGNVVGTLLVAIAPSWALLLLADAAVHHVVSGRGAVPGQAAFAWLEGWVGFVPFNALLPLLLLTFPSGRLLSRRWRWVVLVTVVDALAGAVGSAFAPGGLADYPTVANPLGVHGWFGSFCLWLRNQLTWSAFVVVAILAVASVFVRLRRASGVERQQLKWLFYAASLFAVVFLAWVFSPGRFGPVATELMVAAVPVAVGVAVLRYRLYDIDRLVSRTISYTLLTAAVAAVFVAVVAGVSALLPHESQLALAGATLVSATVANPLRRRLQGLVDRRFNRAPVDAARTVEAFARALSSEVELAAISARLLDTVAGAVEPVSTSLWLAQT